MRSNLVRFGASVCAVLLCLVAHPADVSADVDSADFWPRSKAKINRTVRGILKARYDREFSRESQDALRHLNVYRYLAGAPHDVELDADYQDKAQAACELLALLGGTTHYPANPGWPEDRYEPAATGARNSNLSGGVGSAWPMHFILKSTMHDSDNSNLWELGHRRWNLNAPMQRTGFGLRKGIGAIWVTDTSRPDDWRHDVIAWPPRGYAPVKYWAGPSKHSREPAWSIHLSPMVYALPEYGVPSVRMWKLKRLPPRQHEALKRWRKGLWDDSALELYGVARLEGSGSREPGLTWLPKRARLTKGVRYWVEIQGLMDPEQRREKSIGYLVEGY